jgi:hypothetical protein
MTEAPITAREFQERLALLCATANAGLPRRRRDRHILLRSIVGTLDAKASYSEKSLNVALKEWISQVGAGIAIDHVTLRRYLVDAGYLSRDSGGSTYQVHPAGRGEVAFEPEVGNVDPIAVVRAAREQAAIGKRERSRS